MPDIAQKSCDACDGWAPPLSATDYEDLMKQLDPAWVLDMAQNTLSRRFEFKGFAKAVYLANAAAFLSDKEGHHADVAFGWGYCNITYTSHELGRLSANDFICAAKLDAVVA